MLNLPLRPRDLDLIFRRLLFPDLLRKHLHLLLEGQLLRSGTFGEHSEVLLCLDALPGVSVDLLCSDDSRRVPGVVGVDVVGGGCQDLVDVVQSVGVAIVVVGVRGGVVVEGDLFRGGVVITVANRGRGVSIWGKKLFVRELRSNCI